MLSLKYSSLQLQWLVSRISCLFYYNLLYHRSNKTWATHLFVSFISTTITSIRKSPPKGGGRGAPVPIRNFSTCDFQRLVSATRVGVEIWLVVWIVSVCCDWRAIKHTPFLAYPKPISSINDTAQKSSNPNYPKRFVSLISPTCGSANLSTSLWALSTDVSKLAFLFLRSAIYTETLPF